MYLTGGHTWAIVQGGHASIIIIIIIIPALVAHHLYKTAELVAR